MDNKGGRRNKARTRKDAPQKKTAASGGEKASNQKPPRQDDSSDCPQELQKEDVVAVATDLDSR